jgi:hypothetical protein
MFDSNIGSHKCFKGLGSVDHCFSSLLHPISQWNFDTKVSGLQGCSSTASMESDFDSCLTRLHC